MMQQHYITQPDNIGVSRELNESAKQHLICLLRMIETLPLISEPISSNGSNDSDQLLRQIKTIHKNHVELSKTVAMVLVNH